MKSKKVARLHKIIFALHNMKKAFKLSFYCWPYRFLSLKFRKKRLFNFILSMYLFIFVSDCLKWICVWCCRKPDGRPGTQKVWFVDPLRFHGRDARTEGATGHRCHCHPQFVADNLTLFQVGWQILPTLYYLMAHPFFFFFWRPCNSCKKIMKKKIKVKFWGGKFLGGYFLGGG